MLPIPPPKGEGLLVGWPKGEAALAFPPPKGEGLLAGRPKGDGCPAAGGPPNGEGLHALGCGACGQWRSITQEETESTELC